MNIDWSKAPEWAIGWAVHAFVGEVKEVWVGETQYQRVDQSKSFPYGGGTGDARHNPRRSQFHFEQLRPAPWSGEGLPPAGTVCEFISDMDDGSDWHPQLRNGMRVEVIAHFNTGASDVAAFVFDYDGTTRQVEQAVADCFRPIRTPEQIAAEERSKAIDAMCKECGYDGGGATYYTCAGLYDAGYRKNQAIDPAKESLADKVMARSGLVGGNS